MGPLRSQLEVVPLIDQLYVALMFHHGLMDADLGILKLASVATTDPLLKGTPSSIMNVGHAMVMNPTALEAVGHFYFGL